MTDKKKKPQPRQTAARAPAKHHYEFLGPNIGPLGIMIGLPAVCYALVFLCHEEYCLSFTEPYDLVKAVEQVQFFSWEAMLVFLGWMLFQILLHLILPGERVQGTQLKNKTRLTYKLTGFRNFVVTIALLLYLGFFKKKADGNYILNLAWLYDNYVPLMTCSIAFSSLLSVYLYVVSFAKGKVLAEEGSATGKRIYEFFLGRELNPRIGSLDLKEFCELYPGLIGWIALNMGMAQKQMITYGNLFPSMVLINVFQGVYVLDSLYYEKAILTTMDITTDGFGFMLAFGDLAWVPFTYSLQARVLVHRSPFLNRWFAHAVIALNSLGYLTFRGSNSQKDIFRTDPNDPRVSHLKTLPTERGTKLIVSGWWGMSRHINYFGDWLMGLAWCLTAGLDGGIVPYFYAIYFAILLVHRELRDEEACRKKYQGDYDKYCKIVPYRIIPYIY